MTILRTLGVIGLVCRQESQNVLLNHRINVLGVKDLFWMPVQQYKQDGRIVRGLQRGAHSFSTSTAMAMLELSNRLVTTIQVCSETTIVVYNNRGDCLISIFH